MADSRFTALWHATHDWLGRKGMFLEVDGPRPGRIPFRFVPVFYEVPLCHSIPFAPGYYRVS
jgi:hypothetical protein